MTIEEILAQLAIAELPDLIKLGTAVFAEIQSRTESGAIQVASIAAKVATDAAFENKFGEKP